MIAIVNYGLGNIKAFANIYHKLNIPFIIASNSGELNNADKIILPGVGDFDHAITRLEESGMQTKLEELVLGQKKPVLGICVGMQILANSSEEGLLSGLGWINAEVKKFKKEDISGMPIPHMGWNDVESNGINQLLDGLVEMAKFYFLHSYYFDCKDKTDVIGTTDYGKRFDSIVNHENIFGIQCHPEKSHEYGITLLKNFANL